MPHPTDELVGHRMLFALAQIPKVNASGYRMASLAPLMDLETGEVLQANTKYFPADGYVFWWSVPNMQLSPGDLIVGALAKAAEKAYGSPEQSWYQVSPGATLCTGEVFEIVKTTLEKGAGLRRLVDGRKMIDTYHESPRIFYVWVDQQLVGPFHPQRFESFQSPTGYCCTPVDRVNNTVKSIKGTKLSEYVAREVGYCEVQLSSATYHPSKDPSSRFTRKYRLIRKEDLISLSEQSQDLLLPTDDFAITKACNLLEGRQSKRDAKALLGTLIERLRKDEPLCDSGIVQAVEEIAARVSGNDEAVNRIAVALASTEAVNQRIAQLEKDRVEELIISRAGEIQSEAEKLCEDVLEKLKEVDGKLANANSQLCETELELARYRAEMANKESRLERIVQTATKRLSQGRDELLSDLSLFGSLFSNNLLPDRNGHSMSNGSSPSSVTPPPKKTSRLVGEALSEIDFLNTRLVPVFSEFGLSLPSNKAADFHALMVASNLVSLPDVSWAIAYATSFGGSAVSHCVTVEPNWMSFSQVWAGELGRTYLEAVKDTDTLHVIVLEGIDRCPSHAWLQPFFQLNAGWRTSLPNHEGIGWPGNLRIVFTEDKSTASFPVPKGMLKWVVPFSTDPLVQQESLPDYKEGHLPFQTWDLKTTSREDFAFESLLRELSTHSLALESRLTRLLVRRLRDVYVRLGRDEDRVASAIRWLLRLNAVGPEGIP